MNKGKTRAKKVEATLLRAQLAENVIFLVKRRFESSPDKTKATSEASKKSRVLPATRGTIQRVAKLKTGASLETLQAIADALGVRPYQLLDPNLESALLEDESDAKPEVEPKRKSTAKPKRGNVAGPVPRSNPPSAAGGDH